MPRSVLAPHPRKGPQYEGPTTRESKNPPAAGTLMPYRDSSLSWCRSGQGETLVLGLGGVPGPVPSYRRLTHAPPPGSGQPPEEWVTLSQGHLLGGNRTHTVFELSKALP